MVLNGVWGAAVPRNNDDHIPILEQIEPEKRRKLLVVIRKLSHPTSWPWYDRQLKKTRRAQLTTTLAIR